MVSCGVQLMEFLRSKHPTMAQVLEVVLGDIGGVFALMATLCTSCTVLICLRQSCGFHGVHRLIQTCLPE